MIPACASEALSCNAHFAAVLDPQSVFFRWYLPSRSARFNFMNSVLPTNDISSYRNHDNVCILSGGRGGNELLFQLSVEKVRSRTEWIENQS